MGHRSEDEQEKEQQNDREHEPEDYNGDPYPKAQQPPPDKQQRKDSTTAPCEGFLRFVFGRHGDTPTTSRSPMQSPYDIGGGKIVHSRRVSVCFFFSILFGYLLAKVARYCPHCVG